MPYSKKNYDQSTILVKHWNDGLRFAVWVVGTEKGVWAVDNG